MYIIISYLGQSSPQHHVEIHIRKQLELAVNEQLLVKFEFSVHSSIKYQTFYVHFRLFRRLITKFFIFLLKFIQCVVFPNELIQRL